MEPSHSCWIVDTGVWTQPQPRGDSSIEGAAMQSWSGLSTRRTGLGVLEGERLWRGGEAWHPGQGKGFWRESIFGGEVKYGNFGGEVRLASGRFWQVLAGSGRFWQVLAGSGVWAVSCEL